MPKGTVWGISRRQDGPMKIIGKGKEARENRRRFFVSMGLDPDKAVVAELSHGDHIEEVGKDDCGESFVETDGFITDQSGVILTVTVADCLPIYYFDPKKKALGLAHAGWRGVSNGIAVKMVDRMSESFGTRPEDLEVHMGPHIGVCHFEVGPEVAKRFVAYSDEMFHDGEKFRVDLGNIAKKQLVGTGVKPEAVILSPECTYCLTDDYFSYRRDRPVEIEAMVAFAMMDV